MSILLHDFQLSALSKMRNGCILNGKVGSGKSITSISYYYLTGGGSLTTLKGGKYVDMTDPIDLYIITTARKRDTGEWDAELAPFQLSPCKYQIRVIIDSWNNIEKYVDVKDSFFIFDEQRVVGYGTWSRTFIKISKKNQWVLLSATPGDTWLDYIPVFIANGFYKNKTEFISNHVIWDPHTPFPRVERYTNVGRLIRLRNSILVGMDEQRHTVPHYKKVRVGYDAPEYNATARTKTNPYKRGYIPVDAPDDKTLLIGRDIKVESVNPVMPGWNYEPKNGDLVKLVNKPIESSSEYCYTLRKITNSSMDRINAVKELLVTHPRIIIFYNFDYELTILKDSYYGDNVRMAEWNGHKHQPIPAGKTWVYLVQYTAGCEGWNCISTDTIVFFSQNYSYKVMEQASGRINRMNTPFTDLYYYTLISTSKIDLSIEQSLSEKKKFNERKFTKRTF